MLINNMTPSTGILLCLAIFSVVELGHCKSCRLERPRPRPRPRPVCLLFQCATPPENCRQEIVYDDGCPEACKLVCECPKPRPESLELCNNPDPFCSVEEDFITLADGKRCFSGCQLLCQ